MSVFKLTHHSAVCDTVYHNLCSWWTHRSHFIADKQGVSITSDHPLDNGKVCLCVEATSEVFTMCYEITALSIEKSKTCCWIYKCAAPLHRSVFLFWTVRGNFECEKHWNETYAFHLLHPTSLAQILHSKRWAQSDQSKPTVTTTR